MSWPVATPSRRARRRRRPGQAYYKAKISIDRVELHDTPAGFHIVPGMPITADILVGKRTILTYIFSRALPIAYDGMREP